MAKGAFSSMTPAKKTKFAKVLHEWGQGKLKSPDGKVIKDQKQALAVAFSEAGKVR